MWPDDTSRFALFLRFSKGERSDGICQTRPAVHALERARDSALRHSSYIPHFTSRGLRKKNGVISVWHGRFYGASGAEDVSRQKFENNVSAHIYVSRIPAKYFGVSTIMLDLFFNRNPLVVQIYEYEDSLVPLHFTTRTFSVIFTYLHSHKYWRNGIHNSFYST